jgi:mRNA interferase MazF
MGLQYYPKPGEILMCDYGIAAILPEMVKRRPVVIVSPRLRRRPDLVTIVPLSTTAPEPVEPHHCQITLTVALPPPFDSLNMWAKCDMIATVSLARLDRFRQRVAGGRRQYLSGQLSTAQLAVVRKSVLCGLGLSSLTVHL